ncbi:MAG: hypothetical protein ACR2GD_03900 [Pyrinomonadaceae bacterium]
MKKFLTLSILSLSILITASFAEANTIGAAKPITPAANALEPQVRIRIGRHGRIRRIYPIRRVRVVTRTRFVHRGFRTYRETIQTRYLPNGRVITRVISRVRVR